MMGRVAIILVLWQVSEIVVELVHQHVPARDQVRIGEDR